MLTFTAVCAIIIYAIFDTRELLPHSPCRIAGAISLLVGSKFLESKRNETGVNVIPRQSEFNNVKTI